LYLFYYVLSDTDNEQESPKKPQKRKKPEPEPEYDLFADALPISSKNVQSSFNHD